MAFEFKPLPYAYDALEPTIDAKTMETHHDKHYNGYVNNFNAAVEGTKFDDMCVSDVLADLDALPEDKKQTIINNGGGTLNHKLFWEVMTPGGSKEPVGNLKKAIDETFGSFDKMKEEFNSKGAGQFGSGWAWLVKKDGKLSIMSTPNQNSPVSEGYEIILGNDVWEHAYYLKYQNRRADYLKEWWNVVNWDVAEERFNK